MKTTRSDTEIMTAVAGGDMEAFRIMMDRYSARIVGFLYRFLHDYSRAQDLTQEAFMRLYQQCSTAGSSRTGRTNYRSLIFTIAANLGRDELRRRGVRKEVSMEAVSDAVAGGTPDPAEIVEKKEEYGIAQSALNRLPEDVRELLLLREVQGLSYEEIAEILGLKIGTVKSRINRARIAFKNEYFSTKK